MHVLIILALIAIGLIIFLMKKEPVPAIQTVGSRYEKEISEKEFDEMVLGTSKHTPVLVDFYANWCQPCQYLTPLLAEMAEEYNGAFLLAKIDTDANPRLKAEHEVEAIPTVVLYIDGEPVERFAGGKLEHSIKFTLASHDIHPPQEMN